MEAPSDSHFAFKLCIVGDRHTGKSNLLRCMRDFHPSVPQSTLPPPNIYAPSSFLQTYATTPSSSSSSSSSTPTQSSQSQSAAVPSAVYFDVYFSDPLSPIDGFSSASRYLVDAAGAVVVFDITRLASFAHVDDWIRMVRSACGPAAKVLLVGSRHNLKKRRAVSRRDAEAKAAAVGSAYLELSTEVHGERSRGARKALHDDAKFALDSLALEVIQSLPDPPTWERLRGTHVRALPRYAELGIEADRPLLRAEPLRGKMLPHKDARRSRPHAADTDQLGDHRQRQEEFLDEEDEDAAGTRGDQGRYQDEPGASTQSPNGAVRLPAAKQPSPVRRSLNQSLLVAATEAAVEKHKADGLKRQGRLRPDEASSEQSYRVQGQQRSMQNGHQRAKQAAHRASHAVGKLSPRRAKLYQQRRMQGRALSPRSQKARRLAQDRHNREW